MTVVALAIAGLLFLLALVLYVRADNARRDTFRTASRELAHERDRAWTREREIYLSSDARVAEVVSQLLYAVGRTWDTPPAFRREVASTEPTPRPRTVTEAYLPDADELIRSAFED